MANATATLEENWATHWKWEWLKTGGYDPPRFRERYAGRSCRFAAAGFSDLHSETVAIDGEERVHNVAVK